MKTNNLIACGDCDALQREVPVPAGGLALCVRCGAELYRDKPDSLGHTLAFVVAAMVMFVVANVHPLMGLDASGIRTSATLFDTARALAEAGMASVALLVFFTVIAVPSIQLATMLYMLVPLRLGEVPRHVHLAYRIVTWAQPWGMVEVFLVGAMVSMVRLTQVAEIEHGIGIYAIGAYVMLIAAAVASFEPRELWRRVDELGPALPAREEELRT